MAGYNLDEKIGFMGMFSIKSPSKIIKKSDSIDFKHFNLFDFVKATVVEIDESTIKLSSNDKTPDINASTGDHVLLNFKQGEEEYALSGEIASIDTIDPITFTVNVKKIEKLKDLRKNEKFPICLKAELKMIGVSEPRAAVVKYFSISAIKMNCKDDIMMEDTVDVTMRTDKSTKVIFKGRIVRKNKVGNFYEYGVEISEIAETYSKVLHHLVFTM